MVPASHAIPRILLAAVLVSGLAVSGCGRGGENQAAAPAGQLVAHVGNDVVTTQELENEFRLTNTPADKQKDPQAVKRVLGEIVARKYLVRQALDAKLDREPGVLLDILRSRELVLASAAISRTVGGKVSAISKAEIDKYIANNPAKFSNRQLMTVEQVSFPMGTNAQSVIDATREAKSIDEVDQKLTAMNIPHNRSMGSLNSAELPETLFNQMQMKKSDDVFFLRAGPNGVFIVVKGEEISTTQRRRSGEFCSSSFKSGSVQVGNRNGIRGSQARGKI